MRPALLPKLCHHTPFSLSSHDVYIHSRDTGVVVALALCIWVNMYNLAIDHLVVAPYHISDTYVVRMVNYMQAWP